LVLSAWKRHITWHKETAVVCYRKIGIRQEIVVAIQKLYASNEAQVNIGNRISTGFRTTKDYYRGMV